MYALQAKRHSGQALDQVESLRLELYEKVNALGIGAQGLGGLTTVLDVKIRLFPTHAASMPVAMIPNCAATRHAHFTLDGSGPVYLEPPSLDLWPKVDWAPDAHKSERVDLNTLTRAQVTAWKPGQTLLLSGKMLTGRDAAHKRIQDMLAKGEKLPVDFNNRVIYYVGPVDPVRDEVVGPAGPTTATRMDKFTEMMLSQTGLIAMIGKAERGPTAIEAIKKHSSAYLMAVGGAAYLVSKAIKHARVVAFKDLGMEAIYEFDVQDMPVTVAVDSSGVSAHTTGPAQWSGRIASGEFKNIELVGA
jgi:fumarate hydratase class I